MFIPSLTKRLENFSREFPDLIRFITAGAFVSGVFLIFTAIFKMKQYGEMRTMMSANTDLKIPLSLILAGSALVYFPTMLHTWLATFFGHSYITPLCIKCSPNANTDRLVFDLERFVQIVGLIAFIRGWWIVAKAAGGGAGSQQATFGKGLIHIVGGIFAINIQGTADVLFSTLGFFNGG